MSLKQIQFWVNQSQIDLEDDPEPPDLLDIDHHGEHPSLLISAIRSASNGLQQIS
jgi:hypothetical protein